MTLQQNAPPAPPPQPPDQVPQLPGQAPLGNAPLENAPSAQPTYSFPGSQSPQRLLDAAKAQQSELQRQQRTLESRREDIVDEINSVDTPAAALPGLQARLVEVDARISAMDAQVAEADALVAQRTAVPGAVPPRSQNVSDGPPDGLIALPIVFTIFVLFPLSIAYARRLWTRGGTVVAPVPREVRDRLDQMAEAVESVALEVERIGEGQRFLTRVLTESPRELGAGAMQPVAAPQPVEPARVRREAEGNWTG